MKMPSPLFSAWRHHAPDNLSWEARGYHHFSKIFSFSQILDEPLVKNIGKKHTTIKNRVRCVIQSYDSTGSLNPHSEHKKTSSPKR